MDERKKVTSNPNFVTSDRRKDQASEIRNGDITCNSLSQQTMSNEIEVDRNLFLAGILVNAMTTVGKEKVRLE